MSVGPGELLNSIHQVEKPHNDAIGTARVPNPAELAALEAAEANGNGSNDMAVAEPVAPYPYNRAIRANRINEQHAENDIDAKPRVSAEVVAAASPDNDIIPAPDSENSVSATAEDESPVAAEPEVAPTPQPVEDGNDPDAVQHERLITAADTELTPATTEKSDPASQGEVLDIAEMERDVAAAESANEAARKRREALNAAYAAGPHSNSTKPKSADAAETTPVSLSPTAPAADVLAGPLTAEEEADLQDPNGQIAQALAAIEAHRERVANGTTGRKDQPTGESVEQASDETSLPVAVAAGASPELPELADQNFFADEATPATTPLVETSEPEPAEPTNKPETHGKTAAASATLAGAATALAKRIKESHHNPQNANKRKALAALGVALVAVAAICTVSTLLNRQSKAPTAEGPDAVPGTIHGIPTPHPTISPTKGSNHQTGPEATAPPAPTATIETQVARPGAFSITGGEGLFHQFNDIGVDPQYHHEFMRQQGPALVAEGLAYVYIDPVTDESEFRLLMRQAQLQPDGSYAGKVPTTTVSRLYNAAAAQGFLVK